METKKPADGVQFSIHLIGESSGKLWTGTFRAKETRSFNDRIQTDRIRRDLLGPNPQYADLETASLAGIVADLRVWLTEVPEWWKDQGNGLALEDDNVLVEVYEHAKRIRNEYLAAHKQAGETAQAALKADEQK